MRLLKFRPIILVTIFISAACSKDSDDKKVVAPEPVVHSAHLNDGWYPQDEGVLNSTLNQLFTQAKNEFCFTGDPLSVRGLIVPHAGWYYSGLCAACAYQSLFLPDGSKNSQIERVIILAPSHHVFVNGIGLPEFNVYKTSLGEIKVDTQAIKRLSKSGVFTVMKDAHSKEHAIEVQLPFLQHVLKKFEIVPLVVGNLSEENFVSAVQRLQKVIDNKTLVVVSSDFTHHGLMYDFKPFSRDILAQIRYIDSVAVYLISNYSVPTFDKFLRDTGVTICGYNPIKILMGLAHLKVLGDTLNARLTCYYTSAQRVSGDLVKNVEDKLVDNSVSYVGLVLTNQKLSELKDSDQLTEFEKKSLLRFVRDKIENEFKSGDDKLPDHVLYPVVSTALQKECGVFVTLNTKQGDLRGCIGRILSDLPLFQTVGEMSVASAFHDDRFSPVKKAELDNLEIDISILSAPKKVESYQDIKIGRDGVFLKKFDGKGHLIASSVFLPQVPPSFGWDLQTTLEQLSRKAGMGKDGWKENCEFDVFQGFEIKEK